jgi:hypothetical protein
MIYTVSLEMPTMYHAVEKQFDLYLTLALN